MSSYTVTTNFANKDSLPSGSSDKIIKGAEFTTEFNNIATAINSKADSSQVLTNVPANAVFTDTVYTKPTSEPISYISGLEIALDGKVSTTDADYVKLTNVTVSAAEINYLSGVTSNIQTQINNIGSPVWTDRTTRATLYDVDNDPNDGGFFFLDEVTGSGYPHGAIFAQAGGLQAQPFIYFYLNGSSIGNIVRSGTTGVSYNTSSDYRLKENVTVIDNASERVKQLNPCRFNFIGEQRTVDGFLAHEAQAVVPESVTGDKDAVDAEGNPVYQGIDQSKLVPLLTAALQEALARIEALEAGGA